MAEIQQFTNPIDSLQPSEKGVQGYDQAARLGNRIFTELAGDTEKTAGQAGQEITSGVKTIADKVEQYQSHQEISNLGMSSTALYGAQSKLWNQTINGYTDEDGNVHPPADPRDTSVQAKFMENFEDEADKLRDGAKTQAGQAFAEHQIDAMRKSFQTHTAADMGSRSSDAAVLNGRQTINSLAAGVAANPSMLDDSLKLLTNASTATFGTNEYLSGAQGSALHKEYVQSGAETLAQTAAISAIKLAAKNEQDPEAVARQYVDKYATYFPGLKAESIINLGTTAKNSQLRDIEAQRTFARQQQQDKALGATDAYITDAASGAPKKNLNDILTDPAYAGRSDLRDQAMKTIDTMRQFQSKAITVDPGLSNATSHDLLSRMALPYGDPNRIDDRQAIDKAFSDKTLAPGDYKFLLEQQKAMLAPGEKALVDSRNRFFKDNATAIDPGRATGAAPSILGQQKAFEAEQEAIRMESFLKAKGQDPHSLYDPASPNYFGNQLTRFAVDKSGQLTNANSQYQIAAPAIAKAADIIKNKLESGGDYAAISKASRDGDKAYGAYQVMGKNVGPWTQQYYGRRLAPEEFLGNKEAQDMVFEGEFGKYMKKYGPEGAARAWYAGEAGMHNLGATDVYGKLTVAQYGQRFSAGYEGIQHVGTMTPGEVIAKYPGQIIMLPDGRRMKVPGAPSVPGSQ
jgi:hypothetical protein